jgi:hypothetical protein
VTHRAVAARAGVSPGSYLFAATDPILAADVRVWESHLVATLAAPLEAAGARRPLEAARTLVNLVRGFELERLVDDRLDANDLRRRLEPVIGAVCEPAP